MPTQRLEEERVRRSVLQILGGNLLCSMATITAEGRAHVNTAYFAYSAAFEVYFLSHPRSRHCRNLSQNPSMAMAVFSSRQQWGGSDRGLQLFGRCRPATALQSKRAQALYSKRFTRYARWKATRKEAGAAREYRFYRFVPSRMKVLDEREFGAAVFVSTVVRRTR